jgi:hypothetical protein
VLAGRLRRDRPPRGRGGRARCGRLAGRVVHPRDLGDLLDRGRSRPVDVRHGQGGPRPPAGGRGARHVRRRRLGVVDRHVVRRPAGGGGRRLGGADVRLLARRRARAVLARATGHHPATAPSCRRSSEPGPAGRVRGRRARGWTGPCAGYPRS